MNIEKISEFTAPAAKFWTAIPPETRKLLQSNVWRSKCRQDVTIANFSGAVKGGDLLLVSLKQSTELLFSAVALQNEGRF